LLFAYGPLEKFEAVFRELGFDQGELEVPHPHQHHYRREFDEDADALLEGFDWKKSPLRPEDEQ
jgi:hypothetical protein